MTSNRQTLRRSRIGRPITHHLSLVTFFLLGGGCGATQTFYSDQGDLFRANYSTFEHAFTDAGSADAHRRAQRQCAERKRVAVKTSSACSLTLCTTSFQCMEPDEAASFQGDASK